MDTLDVLAVLRQLQDNICAALEAEEDGAAFVADHWQSHLGSGESRVLKQGAVLEQAGVNFSHVKGTAMPAAATAHRPELAGAAFEAMGVSLVIHPRNPYVPTSHANVRCFIAYPKDAEPVWWFGGGFDLTPFYPFDEDIVHWHQTAKNLCDRFSDGLYDEYKDWCDRYFYLKHREETRGVRGRYVEFNLVFDRGTHFGLQSGGRTESILMSMPPLVRFEYCYRPEEGSDEARLQDYLKPRDWLGKSEKA